MNKKIGKILIYTIQIIFILLLCFLTIESVFKTTKLVTGEKTEYLWDNPIIHIITISLTIGVFILVNKEKIKLSKKKLWILIAIWCVISLIWVLTANLYPRADQRFVYEIAEEMRDGNFKSFEKKGYMYSNPHQSGLLLYEYILGFVFKSKNYLALQVMNILALLGAFYCIYKITRMLFRDKKTSVATIIGLFMFVPLWFYILFIYGNIIGLVLSMAGVLFVLKYLENKKLKYIIFSAITIALAIVAKSNYVITLIALICVLILDIISNKKWKNIISIIILIVVYIVIKLAIPFTVKTITKKEASKGIPMIAYVEMGLENGKRAPGWYNGYNRKVFRKNDYDSEKASIDVKEKLNKSINKFKNNPEYTMQFFYKKTVSQWNNPTFQAFWNNWGKRQGQDKSFVVKVLCGNNIINTMISECMNIIQTIILFGATIYMIINFKKNTAKQLIFAIIFIGGFLFHLIWEAKCQYTITYFVLLIPYSVGGYMDIARCFQNIQQIMPILFLNRKFDSLKTNLQKRRLD